MKDRVLQVQKHYNLNNKQFANELCIAEATISSIYKGRSKPTNNLVQAIHQVYPAININWLMFGEGEMLNPLSGSSLQNGQQPIESGMLPFDQEPNDAIGQNVGLSSSPAAAQMPQNVRETSANYAQNMPQYHGPAIDIQLAEVVSQLKKANEVDKVERKIKEIRVFYSDGTYESFIPNNK